VEVNEEVMTLLSNFEPPFDIDEKSAIFLKMKREKTHVLQCGRRIAIISFLLVYLRKRMYSLKTEFNRSIEDQKGGKDLHKSKRSQVFSTQSESFVRMLPNEERKTGTGKPFKLPPIPTNST